VGGPVGLIEIGEREIVKSEISKFLNFQSKI
jgi:hypothetical protein